MLDLVWDILAHIFKILHVVLLFIFVIDFITWFSVDNNQTDVEVEGEAAVQTDFNDHPTHQTPAHTDSPTPADDGDAPPTLNPAAEVESEEQQEDEQARRDDNEEDRRQLPEDEEELEPESGVLQKVTAGSVVDDTAGLVPPQESLQMQWQSWEVKKEQYPHHNHQQLPMMLAAAGSTVDTKSTNLDSLQAFPNPNASDHAKIPKKKPRWPASHW
jgi:hypothetical protein